MTRHWILFPLLAAVSLHAADLQHDLEALTAGFDGRVGVSIQDARGSAGLRPRTSDSASKAW